MRDRLGDHAGREEGDLTGPNPVDRHRADRSSVSARISAANLSYSRALIPPVKDMPRSAHATADALARQALRLPPPAATALPPRHPAPHRLHSHLLPQTHQMRWLQAAATRTLTASTSAPLGAKTFSAVSRKWILSW